MYVNIFKKSEFLLTLFIIFSIFPIIKIFNISLSFFIFFIILFVFLKNKIKLFKIEYFPDYLLLIFLFIIILSWVFQEDTFIEVSFYKQVKLLFQFIYWIIITLFLKTWIDKYDYIKISKVFFYGCLFSSIYYIFFNKLHPVFAPNAFAYTLVLSFPIASYYIIQEFSFFKKLIVNTFFIFAMIYSQSRTGLVLLMLEFFIIYFLDISKIKRFFLLYLLSFIMIFYVLFNIQSNLDTYKKEIANLIRPIAPKYAYTLTLKEDIFQRDKSFLIRKLMWQKCFDIFMQHPFLGIGPGNFTKFYVDLHPWEISNWLSSKSVYQYNKVSSQNSFIMVLSENGIVALMILLILYLYILINGISFFFRKDSFVSYIYLSIFILIIYSFILVTIMGTLYWLTLGMLLGLLKKDLK